MCTRAHMWSQAVEDEHLFFFIVRLVVHSGQDMQFFCQQIYTAAGLLSCAFRHEREVTIMLQQQHRNSHDCRCISHEQMLFRAISTHEAKLSDGDSS